MIKKNISVLRQKRLPPAYGLLDEAGIFSNNNDELLAKRFSDKVFLKEANNIACEGLNTYLYCDEKGERNHGLNITLGGSFDILNPSAGTCCNPECRRNEATNILRTVGLFADKLFVADRLSECLAQTDPSGLHNLIMMVTAIKTFVPFINEGIIEFRTPFMWYCKDCMARIETELNNFLDPNIDLDADTSILCLGTSKKSNRLAIVNPDLTRLLDNVSLVIQAPKGKKSFFPKLSVGDKLTLKTKDNQYLLETIKDHIKYSLVNVISSIHSAQRTSSLFVSKSELDTLFLSSIDGSNPKNNEIESWEAMRSIKLPWIGELDIPQVLTLRHQASASLESLRESLSLAFMQGGKKGNSSSIRAYIESR